MSDHLEAVFHKAIELKSQGKTDSQIATALTKEGLSKDDAKVLVAALNAQIAEVRNKAERDADRSRIAIIAGCLVAAPLAGWGFFEVMGYNGNFSPISIAGIDVVGSIIATALASIALTAVGTLMSMLASN